MISWPQQGSASTPGGGSPGSSGSVLLCLFSLASPCYPGSITLRPYHPGSITLWHGVACPWASPPEECERRVGSEAPRQASLARAGESPRPTGIPGSPHLQPSCERERNWTLGSPRPSPLFRGVPVEAWVVGKLSVAVVGRAACLEPLARVPSMELFGPRAPSPRPMALPQCPWRPGSGGRASGADGGALAGLSALGFSMRLSEQKSPRRFSPKPPEIPKV